MIFSRFCMTITFPRIRMKINFPKFSMPMTSPRFCVLTFLNADVASSHLVILKTVHSGLSNTDFMSPGCKARSYTVMGRRWMVLWEWRGTPMVLRSLSDVLPPLWVKRPLGNWYVNTVTGSARVSTVVSYFF